MIMTGTKKELIRSWEKKRANLLAKLRLSQNDKGKIEMLDFCITALEIWEEKSIGLNRLESNAKTYKKAVNVLKKSAKKRIEKNGKI